MSVLWVNKNRLAEMADKTLRIGFSACFFHADPKRALFKGKTLLFMEESMVEWAMGHNALPILLPQPTAGFSPENLVDEIDGLLLQGGADVCPRSYGEEPMRKEWSGDEIRDRYEIALIRACLEKNKPILAICRGTQILNVALGGSLYQDIGTQVKGALVHRDWNVYDGLHQDVVFAKGSRLTEIYGGATGGRINSIHHQSIKDVAPCLRIEATSPQDGIIEAVCLDASLSNEAIHQGRFALGIQWHPEFIKESEASLLDPSPLMEHFLSQVRANKKQ